MIKFNLYNRGQSLVVVVIILFILAGLALAGVYFYLDKQLTELSTIPEVPAKQETIEPKEETPSPMEEEEEEEEEEKEEEIIPEEIAPIEEEPAEEPIIQKCSDGTLHGQCSTHKPKYCDNGSLIDKCSSCSCPPYQFCRNNSCVSPISPAGVVLVRKDSDVERIAEQISNERDWIFTSIESSDPLEIKKEINKISTEHTTIKYLLIIGTNEQIPIRDRWGFIEYEKSESYESGQGSVLDSLFYGNTDEDILVELEVGRIPYSNENDVRNYFKDLAIGGSKNYYVYYPIYEKVGEHEKSPGICLSKEFNNTSVLIEPERETLMDAFDDAQTFVMNTHGLPGSWSVKDGLFNKNDVPDLYRTRPLVITNSCLSAQELGPEFLKKGAGAFIGQYFVTGDFGVDRSLVLSKKIFVGESLGSSLKNYINYGIVAGTINKKFMYNPTEEPIAVMDINNSVVADHTIILFGDPSITIKPLLSSLDKVSLEKKNDTILIKIPKPLIETIDDEYVVQCYGGENETDKKGRIKEHWDMIINLGKTPKNAISEFIFPIENINSIQDGKEIIDGREFEFQTVRVPFASLVKGTTERYLMINETLIMDPSIFFNPREIFLEF